ncbi:MAG: LysE family transporter [Bacteroidales bacterium]|nr:LysE family transporter [Bacteroidales bacterium]
MEFAFIQGILIGLIVSIPMGPIGVLCVHRTLTKGRAAGLVSGLGAATADTFFAIIAVFGLSFVTEFIEHKRFYLMFIGGIVLVAVGISMFLKNTIKQYKQKDLVQNRRLMGSYFSTFGLTLANPLTIIGIGTILAVYANIKDEFQSMFILIVGVFTGAAFYWTLLTQIVNAFKKKFNLRFLWYLNKIAGIVIIIFGLFAIFNAFYPKI